MKRTAYNTAPIRAVIFDMDGVLIDSEPSYRVAQERMMSTLGLPFGPEQILAFTGASYQNLYGKLLGWDPNLKATVSEVQDIYVSGLLGALRDEVHSLVDGVLPLMEFLRERGVLMAIGSSSHRDMVDFAVERFGLEAFLSAVVTGSDTERGKPAPDIFLMCADALGVRPEECLVIEDSVNGLKAAVNAGMPCAAFLGTSHHPFDLSGALLTLSAFDSENFDKLEPLFSEGGK